MIPDAPPALVLEGKRQLYERVARLMKEHQELNNKGRYLMLRVRKEAFEHLVGGGRLG